MTERGLPVTILEPAGIDPELLDHSLSLRFDLGQFDPRIAFTRNSSATYFGSDGLLKTAAVNEPRIDYDPVTGECKGFLVEEGRTNLLTYSEQFDNASWTKNATSATANAISAPDGTITADKIVENSTNSVHAIRNIYAFAANTSYSASIYVKAGERTSGIFLVFDNGSNIGAWHINLLTGELAQGSVSLASTAKATNVGSGWWRISVSFVSSAAPSGSYFDFRQSNTWPIAAPTGSAYIGDNTSGIYVWGAQLEVGSFPTSYIKTEATATTRAADTAVMTGTNFSSWYRQDEGTFLLKASLMNAGGVGQNNIVTLGSSSTVFYRLSGAASLRSYDGTNVLSSNPVLSPGALFSAALTYGSGAMAQSVNGLAVKSAAFDGDFGGNLDIGGSYSDRKANAHIARLSYFPKRLANAKLQTLTQ